MALTKETKQELIKKFEAHPGDTGSPAVQIALLTQQINFLTEHLKTHKKDTHSRKGLLQMVGKRRRLIEYFKGTDEEGYKKAAKALKI